MAGPRFYVCLIPTAVFSVLLARYLYVPLPKNIAEREKMHVADAVMRVTYHYPANFLLKFSPYLKLYWTRFVLTFFARLLGPWSNRDPDLHIFDTDFKGVPVRVYVPKGDRSNDGAIIFVHGGGFVLMDVDSYDGLTRFIARNSSMVVVSIDYRLAPEHVFPAGINDVENATVHFIQTAHRQYGVDPAKVVIMGDSAGGNLAAVTTQRLRARKDLKNELKLQVLLYPVVQYVDFLTPSYQRYYKEYSETSFLDPESIARWLMMYLGVDAHDERVEKVLQNNHTTLIARRSTHFDFVSHNHLPEEYKGDHYVPPAEQHGDKTLHDILKPFLLNPEFSPLMAEDMSGLPTAMVMTCEYDILRDEGFWYSKRLKDNGVEVEHRHYDRGFHAMLNFHTEVELAQQAVTEVVDFINRNL